MASNFRILFKRKNNQSLFVQLYGDFDGTSAHELVNFLDNRGRSYRKVAIDTEGLRTIHAFALNVFINKVKRLQQPHLKIKFTGRFNYSFIQD